MKGRSLRSEEHVLAFPNRWVVIRGDRNWWQVWRGEDLHSVRRTWAEAFALAAARGHVHRLVRADDAEAEAAHLDLTDPEGDPT